MFRLVLLIITSALPISACGLKGGLYLPEKNTTPVVITTGEQSSNSSSSSSSSSSQQP